MRLKKIILFALFCLVATTVAVAQQCPVKVKWAMGENQKRTYTSSFTITNVSDKPLEGGWALYYNKFSNVINMAEGQALDIKPVTNYNYVCLTPNAAYKTLQPGESMTVNMVSGGNFRNISDKPDGMHFVPAGSDKALPVAVEITPLQSPNQFNVSNMLNYPDGKYMYAENAISNPEDFGNVGTAYDIFPTPKQIVLNAKGDIVSIPNSVEVVNKGQYLENAKKYLIGRLKQVGVNAVAKAKYKIVLEIRPTISKNYEYYQLSVERKSITIAGQSATAVLNGVKTLAAVLERHGLENLPCAVVDDYPDFHYRGMMLDISRNYTTYPELLDFIDRLAEYKVNSFQLHFCDDEAWRLEIPGLPELTEVGARKGFTLNDYEAGFLMQTYAGTGNPDDGLAPANGYITRDQFVNLLKYAHERDVKIIPEVETPGHARAAIVAMRYRYKKYKDIDKEKANYYRNFDLDDAGVFESAQGFKDNVLNVAEPGTYRMLMKVVSELQKMYADAGLRLDVLHLGGDEVAGGCWNHSPKVKELMKENGYTTERDVAEHFFLTISRWLKERDIKVEGWQEVSLNHGEVYNKEVLPMLAGVNVWSTIGARDTIAYSFANRGLPVILSNVNNLYLDLVYRPHENENGLTWGGCVDEILSWETLPFNIYRSAQINYDGSRKDLAKADIGKPKLQREDCILGLQAQLWSETIRNYSMVQEYVFPKIFGLVERAWNARPDWGEGALDMAKYRKARANYNLRIGMRELPHLSATGSSFHVAQPGAVVENGMLKVNTPYPDMVVRYTTDGSEPTEQSAQWTAPVNVPQGVTLIKVKAFYLGKQSVATRLEVK